MMTEDVKPNGEIILGDKCDETWTERECPTPASCAVCHYGQHGHKVIHLFCDACFNQPPYAAADFGGKRVAFYQWVETFTPEESEKWTKEWKEMFG